MNEHYHHYSMLIEWSKEDEAYLVTLPEWAGRVIMPVTHGDTYSEAVLHGQEVLKLLINSAMQDNEPLPLPKMHVTCVSYFCLTFLNRSCIVESKKRYTGDDREHIVLLCRNYRERCTCCKRRDRSSIMTSLSQKVNLSHTRNK